MLTIAQSRHGEFQETTERMRKMQSEVEQKALRISEEVSCRPAVVAPCSAFGVGAVAALLVVTPD